MKTFFAVLSVLAGVLTCSAEFPGRVRTDQSLAQYILANSKSANQPLQQQCFGMYMPLLQQAATNWSTTYNQCVEDANINRTLQIRQMAGPRDEMKRNTYRVCNYVTKCTKIQDSLRFFQCFASLTKNEIKNIYAVADNATIYATQMIQQSEMITVNMYLCTNRTERIYVETTATIYEALDYCLQYGLPKTAKLEKSIKAEEDLISRNFASALTRIDTSDASVTTPAPIVPAQEIKRSSNVQEMDTSARIPTPDALQANANSKKEIPIITPEVYKTIVKSVEPLSVTTRDALAAPSVTAPDGLNAKVSPRAASESAVAIPAVETPSAASLTTPDVQKANVTAPAASPVTSSDGLNAKVSPPATSESALAIPAVETRSAASLTTSDVQKANLTAPAASPVNGSDGLNAKVSPPATSESALAMPAVETRSAASVTTPDVQKANITAPAASPITGSDGLNAKVSPPATSESALAMPAVETRSAASVTTPDVQKANVTAPAVSPVTTPKESNVNVSAAAVSESVPQNPGVATTTTAPEIAPLIKSRAFSEIASEMPRPAVVPEIAPLIKSRAFSEIASEMPRPAVVPEITSNSLTVQSENELPPSNVLDSGRLLVKKSYHYRH